VSNDDVDREIAAIEGHERSRAHAQHVIVDAARSAFSDRLGGVWVEDDQETLVISVTGDPTSVESALRSLASTPLRVVAARHTLIELEALAERVWSTADEVGAPLYATGIIEPANRVEVMLEDLQAPASVRLRERFKRHPISWIEGSVEAV
jgi:hypothetical protein